MNITQLPDSALERSILIVAHPDDELLWFGSIVKNVGHIVICFLDDPTSPGVGSARQRCLAEHPYREKITCLEFPETGTFNQASWPHPEISEFGLRISGNPEAALRYEKCAIELGSSIAPFVKDASNIFTHNPWGEYGHVEHVLVHRAVTAIAQHSGNTIWHSNYVSHWSQPLMEQYLSNSHVEYHQNDVDGAAMLELSRCYKQHGAWTWMNDYRWLPQECYIQGPLSATDAAEGGWLYPLNFIRISGLQAAEKIVKRSLPARASKKLARTINRISGWK